MTVMFFLPPHGRLCSLEGTWWNCWSARVSAATPSFGPWPRCARTTAPRAESFPCLVREATSSARITCRCWRSASWWRHWRSASSSTSRPKPPNFKAGPLNPVVPLVCSANRPIPRPDGNESIETTIDWKPSCSKYSRNFQENMWTYVPPPH